MSYLFLFSGLAGVCRPAQKESKRGVGHVVFILISSGGWLCRPASKESKIGFKTCRICSYGV